MDGIRESVRRHRSRVAWIGGALLVIANANDIYLFFHDTVPEAVRVLTSGVTLPSLDAFWPVVRVVLTVVGFGMLAYVVVDGRRRDPIPIVTVKDRPTPSPTPKAAGSPTPPVWPPALRSVPAAGIPVRVQEWRTSRNNAIAAGRNLRSRLWGFTRYQLDKRKVSLEAQAAAFMQEVDDHKRDWWSQGRPGEFDLKAEVQPVDPTSQVPWQAEMSERIDAELKWLEDHGEPGRDE